MKTLVAAFITALLVFTLATAWIEVVQPRLDMLAFASSPKSRAKSATSLNKRNSLPTTTDEDDEDSLDESAAKPPRTAKAKRAEAAKKEKFLAQLEQVKQREAKLLERQATMELLYQDIRRELAEVEEIRRRSAAELAMAERKVLDSIANKAENTSQANAADNQPKTTARQKVAAEASIAAAIQDLASHGNVKDAMILLSGMQDREVAKVLMSLSSRDPSLALRLSDQVHAAKQGAVRQ